MQFMEARAAYDGASLTAMMSPDAMFGLTEIAQSVDDVARQSEWERAVGWQFLDPSCETTSATVVICHYTIQGELNERIGAGPYRGNSFVLTISDGRIERVDHALAAFDFYTDTEVQFYSWVEANHPGDLAVMLEGDRLLGGDYPSFPHLTDTSIRLWAEHTAGYIASLE